MPNAAPFAQAVLAHLKARETHEDPDSRCDWKIRLVRNLYERGFRPREVRELFRLMDWLMVLPPPLVSVFWQELEKIQVEKRMPYITSIERLGRCRGMCRGIEALLHVRFGEEGLKLMPEIREIHEEEKLEAILQSLGAGVSLEDVRRVWLPGTP
jgi:hypothetical protein